MINRYKERSEIEALYFAVNTQLATLKQPSFTPPDGISVHALQRAWDALEKAEHRREVALREELLRQERLEQLAYKFERKVLFLFTTSCKPSKCHWGIWYGFPLHEELIDFCVKSKS